MSGKYPRVKTMKQNDFHPVSILPDCDSDEGYCERHQYEMKSVNPLVKFDGAAYTTADDFSIYYCPACLIDVAQMLEQSPSYEYEIDSERVYRAHLIKFFKMWDEGESPANWFKYVGEVPVENDEAFFVAFDEEVI